MILKRAFEDTLEPLQAAVFARAKVVVTTMSNSCDKRIGSYFLATHGMADERDNLTEPGTFI